MKITQINANISAVVPTGEYQNYRPSYSMTAELDDKDNPEESLESLRSKINKLLRKDVMSIKEKDKMAYYQKIRFYTKNGKKYPSVTSILGWAKHLYDINNPSPFGSVGADELMVYGARGTIVHQAIEHWFKTKEWKTNFDNLVVESNLLRGHKIKVEDCNWLGFWEKFGKDIEFKFMERAVYGKNYAGRLDAYGTYKGEPAVFDFKTTSNYTPQVESNYYKQLSAYAKAVAGVKKPTKLVLIPLNPTNKCGYGAPKVIDYSENLFNNFELDVKRFYLDFKGLL